MKRIAVAAALAALLPTIVSAHDFWIEPSSFRPATGTTVSVALRVGETLRGDPVPRMPRLVQRFVLKSRRGEVPVPGTPGADPAGAVRVSDPGPQWIGYQSTPSSVTLDAQKFHAYLREEGLEHIITQRTKSGRATAPGRERFSRCAKALLDVAGPKGTSAIDVPLGFTLELVPRQAPGTSLPVTLLFRGKPLANALVVARSKAAPDRVTQVRTDAKGHATLPLGRPGFWLIKAVHMEAAPSGSGVDWESWWASVTFDLRQ